MDWFRTLNFGLHRLDAISSCDQQTITVKDIDEYYLDCC